MPKGRVLRWEGPVLQRQGLWQLLHARADETPDALAVVDGDMRTLTFLELFQEAELTAAGLYGHGIDRNTVVSWQLPTWIESLVLMAALSRLGAIQQPLLPACTIDELADSTATVAPDLLVVPGSWHGRDYLADATEVMRRNGDGRVLICDRALPQGDSSDLPPAPEEGEEKEVRWYFPAATRAGTVGQIQHSDAALAIVGSGLAQRLGLLPADRVAVVSQFADIGGVAWLAAMLVSGCALILVENFDAEETPDLLTRERVTVAESALPFHEALVAAQQASLSPLFSELRCFAAGGAITAGAFDEARRLFDVPTISGYGFAECPLLTMGSVHDSDAELCATDGKPLPGVRLRVTDPDGMDLPNGMTGEIRATAPQMMQGHLDPSLDGVFDERGYLCTRDLGHIDDLGNLVVTGSL